MIMHSIIAANNVIKYNNELSTWVNKICNEIEKKARAGRYNYYVVIDSRSYNMAKNVATFFQDKLGYRVYMINSDVIDIYWQYDVIDEVRRDDYLAAEAACSTADAVYLTAIAACNIADDASKSYNYICDLINRYIETCSKRGESHCIYNTGNLCSSIVEEIEEDLLDAGYDVELRNNKFIIKWANSNIDV